MITFTGEFLSPEVSLFDLSLKWFGYKYQMQNAVNLEPICAEDSSYVGFGSTAFGNFRHLDRQVRADEP